MFDLLEVITLIAVGVVGPNSGREAQRRDSSTWQMEMERGRWRWTHANVAAVRGSYGPCRLCKNHTLGGWRRCPACVTWCGAGCEPERCWAGDDVNLCRLCVQLRDRWHAICVVRDQQLLVEVGERVFRYIG